MFNGIVIFTGLPNIKNAPAFLARKTGAEKCYIKLKLKPEKAKHNMLKLCWGVLLP